MAFYHRVATGHGTAFLAAEDVSARPPTTRLAGEVCFSGDICGHGDVSTYCAATGSTPGVCPVGYGHFAGGSAAKSGTACIVYTDGEWRYARPGSTGFCPAKDGTPARPSSYKAGAPCNPGTSTCSWTNGDTTLNVLCGSSGVCPELPGRIPLRGSGTSCIVGSNTDSDPFTFTGPGPDKRCPGGSSGSGPTPTPGFNPSSGGEHKAYATLNKETCMLTIDNLGTVPCGDLETTCGLPRLPPSVQKECADFLALCTSAKCPTSGSATGSGTGSGSGTGTGSGSGAGAGTGSGAGAGSGSSGSGYFVDPSAARSLYSQGGSATMFRRAHGAEALTFVDSGPLMETAKAAALYNATHVAADIAAGRQPTLTHTDYGTYGQNLYAKWGTGLDAKDAVSMAEKDWEGERDAYCSGVMTRPNPPATPPQYPMTGHFSQAAWKGSKEVACAAYVVPGAQNAVAVACNYNPRGNVSGYYGANVSC